MRIALGLLYFSTSASMAQVFQGCALTQEEQFLPNLIELTEFQCNDQNKYCSVRVRAPKKIGESKFIGLTLHLGAFDEEQFMTQMVVFRKQEYVTGSVFGREDYLEKLDVRAAYTDGNGCGPWSRVYLKHNKKRNEMDGSKEPPIR